MHLLFYLIARTQSITSPLSPLTHPLLNTFLDVFVVGIFYDVW